MSVLTTTVVRVSPLEVGAVTVAALGTGLVVRALVGAGLRSGGGRFGPGWWPTGGSTHAIEVDGVPITLTWSEPVPGSVAFTIETTVPV